MVRTRVMSAVVIAAALAAACGGKGAPASGAEEPVDTSGDDGEGDGKDDVMVAPERMDEIKALLDRKRSSVARCLPEAIDAGKAEKNARGRVTLEFVISAAGKAESIKVAEATLESEMVQECTKQHVASIDFGALPRRLDWSYTYSFEAY